MTNQTTMRENHTCITCGRILYTIGELNELKDKIREEEREKLELNIGMLRQWLNEDRITDIDKLITSEDIKHWIFKEPIDFKDVDLLDKK